MDVLTFRHRWAGPGLPTVLPMGGPGRHHGFGPGPWGPPFEGGPGMPGGGPFFFRRRRMRRGDVRSAILVLLAEAPENGYGLMQEIERRSDGVWRPSPGSVYPALQQLEDEGLVRSEEADGRRQFQLTDAGRAYVEEHRDRLGEPWADVSGGVGEGAFELRGLVFQLGAAASQVLHAGDEAQVARAREVLEDARRTLYRILAGDDKPAG